MTQELQFPFIKKQEELIKVPLLIISIVEKLEIIDPENEIRDMIDMYDSEVLERNNNDLYSTLKDLWEKIIVQYILTDDMLFNYATEIIWADVYFSEEFWKTMLEISDRRIFNEITVKIDPEDLEYEVHSTLEMFQNKIKEEYYSPFEIWWSWRSGRHIVIPLSYQNILIYKTVKELYEQEEENFLKYINWKYYLK